MTFGIIEFRNFQQRILAVMDHGEEILRSPNPDLTRLRTCRAHVTAALTTYQLYKHRELFPALEKSPFKAVADNALKLQIECVRLGNDFRAHSFKWRDRDVSQHWESYSQDALALIMRMRQQLLAEQQEAEQAEWLGLAPAARVNVTATRLQLHNRPIKIRDTRPKP